MGFSAKRRRKKPKVSVGSLEALVQKASNAASAYEKDAHKDGDAVLSTTLIGRGSHTHKDFANIDAARVATSTGMGSSHMLHPVFEKGQSKRIWNELYKVLDCSDVVVQVLDARDPIGTRSKHVEAHLRKDAKHKHLIFVLNK